MWFYIYKKLILKYKKINLFFHYYPILLYYNTNTRMYQLTRLEYAIYKIMFEGHIEEACL
jgi:hypothetical protein